MEWIRGGPLPSAAFQIDQARFTLPSEVMNKPEVVASGLGMLMRKEGFKEIPPVVPRTPDGAFILSRPPEAFELLVEHLLGLEPLTRVPLRLFADKYIALKSELTFWQLPTEDVPFHDHIYFETAWTGARPPYVLMLWPSPHVQCRLSAAYSPPAYVAVALAMLLFDLLFGWPWGLFARLRQIVTGSLTAMALLQRHTGIRRDEHCLFPLAPPDAEAFKREKMEEPTTFRRAVLESVHECPAELSDELLHAADRRPRGDEESPAHPEKWEFFVFDASGGEAAAAQGKTAPSAGGRLIFAVGQTRFLCKIPFLATPCVHYGKLPDREGAQFPPFLVVPSSLECTLVWTAGCFVHIKVKESSATVSAAEAARAAFSSAAPAKGPLYAEVNVIEQTPSWLCFHPILDFVLSGVKGPVPNVYTFDLPNASAIRFYPWGALVINGEVELQPRRKLEGSGATRAQTAAAFSSGALAERRRSTEDNMKRLLTFLPGQQQQVPRAPGEAFESPHAPAKPVVLASILRSKQKAVKPIEKIYIINMDHENEAVLTMKHGVDYDVLDTRNQDGTDFEIVVSIRGGLACRKREDFQETKRSETAAVIAVDGLGRMTTHSHVLIKNGVPQGEMLRSMTLTGEYSVSDRQYYKFELGTKLFEFHRSLYMLRSAQSTGACNIM